MNKPSLQAVPEPDGGTQDAAVTTPQLDPFDPANLRLSQSFTETVGVKKLLTTVPVRAQPAGVRARSSKLRVPRKLSHHRAER